MSAASAIRWRQLVVQHGTPAAKPQGGDRRAPRIDAHATFILEAIEAKDDITPRLLGSAFDPSRTLPDARADMAACGEASSRWDTLWKRAKALVSDVDPARRDYYQTQVLTMIAVNRESNLMLEDTARAVLLLADDDRSGAAVQADAAIAALDRLRGEMDKAEYGEWRGWYRGDWITGVARTRAMLATWAAWARDPASPILPPLMWSNWEASFHIQHCQGDHTVEVH